MTLRTIITIDFVVEDGTDPDVFHDALREYLEDPLFDEHLNALIDVEGVVDVETVRQIVVEELED